MRKSVWKHKLYITQDDGARWYTNGHWAVNDSIARNVKGLKSLINLRPGVYRDHKYCEEEKTPDVARVVKSAAKVGDPIELRDTGWIVGKADGETMVRILITAHEETPRMVLIDDRYAELYENSGTLKGPLWWNGDYSILIGSPRDPDGVIMTLREMDGGFETGGTNFTLPL